MESIKPNILFILIDDLGWRDLGCYGSSFYETPNIDRLAEGGIRFTDAYAACPVCSPTRASLLTGKYPATLGITQFIGGNGKGKLLGVPYIKQLPLEEVTIAKKLKKEVGYRTFHVGKWHLGKESFYPEKHGFDVNIAGCDWGMPLGGYFSPYYMENLKDGPKGEFLTDRLTSEAITLIEENEKTEDSKSFFMYLSYYAVHIPIEAPKHLIHKYEEKAKKLGLDKRQIFAIGEKFPIEYKKQMRIKRRVIQSDPAYSAMIESLDENVGRLLIFLEEQHLMENTIIFFYSDNGGLATAETSPTSNLPLSEGKGWLADGGVRVPLIVYWKNHIQPTACSVPITSPDFFPTLMELTNVEYNKSAIDGVSILPLLRGETELNRDAIYWHYPHYSNQGCTPGCSIRNGDYKLIEFFEDGRLELYNLKEDLEEQKNLSSIEPEITKQLYGKLKIWRENVEAKIPQRNPDYGRVNILSKIKGYFMKWGMEFWEFLMRHGRMNAMKQVAKRQLKNKRALKHE